MERARLLYILDHEKPLKFKYGVMQKKILSRLVFGSCGACLGCLFLRVQGTAGLECFSAFNSFS